MRRLSIAILVFTSIASIAAGATVATGAGALAGHGHRRSPAVRVTQVGGGVSVEVPPGWQVIRGWLSDVVIPIPRLALASFPAELSHHTCACGFPNLRRLPANGAFLFVWEYPALAPRILAHVPRRPAHFRITGTRPTTATCLGPSDTLGFRTGARAFQVEIYLGPQAGPRARAQLTAALDSFRVSPGPIRAPAARPQRP